MVNFIHKTTESLIFWLILTAILSLLCLLGLRSLFMSAGFTGNEGLFLSIMLTFPILIGIYTLHNAINVEKGVQRSSHGISYKLSNVRKLWQWRSVALLVAVFSFLTALKYVLLSDFIRAFVVATVCSFSVYGLMVFAEILTHAARRPLSMS